MAAAISVAALSPMLRADTPRPGVRLLDLNRTGQSSLSPYLDAQSFTVAGGRVYFPAWSFAEGYELWRSDGTAAGTQIVADLMPGNLSSGPGQLVRVGDRLCFVATDTSNVVQIFVDDVGAGSGAAAPPIRLTNFTGDQNALPGLVGAAGSMLIFSGPLDDQMGLWSIEVAPAPGNPAPTPRLLGRFDTGPAGAGFGGTDAASNGSRLYFVADDGAHGRELWRTDGTGAGTELLVDLVPGPAGSDPIGLASINGRLFLNASTPDTGREPWVCDATGARLLGDLNPSIGAATGSSPEGFTVLGDRVIFAASNATEGRELWTTSIHGDPLSTQRLTDLWPGPEDGIAGPFKPTRVGNVLFFAARDPTGGAELWVTDGTPAGTRRHADLRAGPTGSDPAALLEFGGRLVFQAITNNYGYQLWIAEPASGGGGSLGAPRRMTYLAFSDDETINRTTTRPCASLLGGDRPWLIFPGFRLDTGIELFRSEGQSTTAELIRDIRAGSIGSSPAQLARLGHRVVFTARNELGSEPWISDGDPAETRPLADLSPGRAGSNPGPFVVGGNGSSAIFRATSVPGASPQWYQATTSASVLPAVTPVGISESSQSISPRSCELGAQAVVAARRPDVGDEPFAFVMGGSLSADPELLIDIVPGPGSSSPYFFSRVGDAAVFFAAAMSTPSGAVVEIWRSDATPAGTRRMIRLVNPNGSRVVSTAVRPVAVGPCLFFVADDGTGDELWVSRVDTGQTFRVADIEPGPRSSFPTSLCASFREDGEPQLFFTAQRDDLGSELWVARISSASVTASVVIDLIGGTGSGAPVSIVSPRDPDGQPTRAGVVYFSATDGRSGRQLWSSDGSAANTQRLTDLTLNPNAAVQSVLGVVGQPPNRQVFFRLIDPGSASGSAASLLGSLYITDRSTSGASAVLMPATLEPMAPGSTVLEINSRVFLSVTDRLAGAEFAVIDRCPADFDNSGAIDVNDLFQFLGKWLPAYGQLTPNAADLSFDNRVDMADLFAFLDGYFRGCP